ncbi:hypothetical protein PRUPE_1G575300, partial [Prunus persica]
ESKSISTSHANKVVYHNLTSHLNPSLLNLKNLHYLDLSNNDFEGRQIPNFFGSLASLRHLDLSQADFQGIIPPQLGNLSNLCYLDLHDNYFEVKNLQWISDLSLLQHLDMSVLAILYGEISSSIGNLTNIVNLDLYGNQLEGQIPNSLGNLCKLTVLDLSRNHVRGRVSEILESLSWCNSSQLESLSLSSNNLSGHLTEELGKFRALTVLDLSSNSISGPIPMSLGNLSFLEQLRIHNNSFTGVVSEVHFANLTRLVQLYANKNSLTLKASRDWLPPFLLQILFLDSWDLGPELPMWLQRHTQLQYLSISDTRISGTIPTRFWNFSSQLRFVDLSQNQLYGEVPNILGAPLDVIDLSSNNFSGSLPLVSSTVDVLDLSNSSFSGSIFHFFCDSMDRPKQLRILYLENNNLAGEIPEILIVLNLDNISFIGNIPISIGHLLFLQSLHLRNNHLSGENKFTGSIQTWIGESNSNLIILSLRSTMLHGDIPHELCNLVNLQILDLAHNNLSGTIPRCFNSFSAMVSLSNSGGPISFFSYTYGSSEKYMENAILVTKGRELKYGKFLTLVTSLDLSDNMISGEIPQEVTSLTSLLFLNLSRNHLTGKIPSKIGDMGSLESLDLSMNHLSGEIPPSMSTLTFLADLNLSYNNLTGQIPKSTQIQGFDQSRFIGNKLCGLPLNESCKANWVIPPVAVKKHRGSHLVEDGWFYLSLGLGFMFGFWSVLGSLLLNFPWSFAFSQLLNSIVQRLNG